jgi:hypothetical protein
MYGIYANIGGIVMVNVTIYGIHGSYGYIHKICIYKLYIYVCVYVYVWPFGNPAVT